MLPHICLLWICLPLTQLPPASEKITEIAFYGFEDPSYNLQAPRIIMTEKFLKGYQDLFVWQATEKNALLNPKQDPYFLAITYKQGARRVLSVYTTDSGYWMTENGECWMVPEAFTASFHSFLTDCRLRMYEEQHILLGQQQIRISLRAEDSLMSQVASFLQTQSVDNAISYGQDSLAKRASGLIETHLSLYEKYYNFKKIRSLILESFQSLAITLKDKGMPVQLMHSGIQYQPWYSIMKNNDSWVCYVGDCVVAGHMAEAYERFNQVATH